MAGFFGKLAASWLRWWVLVDFYNGSGDAVGYHNFARFDLVHIWRSFQVPNMKIGTEAMEGVTGLVYVPYIPSMLGGFFEFASIAFIGQIFLYVAFRNSVVPRRLKLYAFAVFFTPNIVYWPSSIGKEAVMFLGLGIAAYGISRLLTEGSAKSLMIIAAGMFISGLIRPHVTAMQAAAAVGALMFAKGGVGIARMPGKRLVLVGIAGIGLAGVLLTAASSFGITLEDGGDVEGQVDQLVTNVEAQTDKGGSSVEGGFITSPTQFPEAADARSVPPPAERGAQSAGAGCEPRGSALPRHRGMEVANNAEAGAGGYGVIPTRCMRCSSRSASSSRSRHSSTWA